MYGCDLFQIHRHTEAALQTWECTAIAITPLLTRIKALQACIWTANCWTFVHLPLTMHLLPSCFHPNFLGHCWPPVSSMAIQSFSKLLVSFQIHSSHSTAHQPLHKTLQPQGLCHDYQLKCQGPHWPHRLMNLPSPHVQVRGLAFRRLFNQFCKFPSKLLCLPQVQVAVVIWAQPKYMSRSYLISVSVN